MTNALLAIIATTLIIGVAILAKRRASREERATDDEHDLTRRRPGDQTVEAPPPGAPEWMPPGRDPEAHV